MCIQKNLIHSAWITSLGIVITIMILTMSSKVYAQASTPLPEDGTCASCHEDLYFLHDTGNWFCLRESPMRCVDCHGGDPYTFNQNEAHTNRKPHPIVNENISKCRECHPAECDERVVKFESVSRMSDVLVAAPLQTKPKLPIEEVQAAPITEPVTQPAWTSFLEIIVLVLIAGLALAIYFAHKAQHIQK